MRDRGQALVETALVLPILLLLFLGMVDVGLLFLVRMEALSAAQEAARAAAMVEDGSRCQVARSVIAVTFGRSVDCGGKLVCISTTSPATLTVNLSYDYPPAYPLPVFPATYSVRSTALLQTATTKAGTCL